MQVSCRRFPRRDKSNPKTNQCRLEQMLYNQILASLGPRSTGANEEKTSQQTICILQTATQVTMNLTKSEGLLTNPLN